MSGWSGRVHCCCGIERDSNIKVGERKHVGKMMSNDSVGSQLREIANLRDPRALYTQAVSRCESF